MSKAIITGYYKKDLVGWLSDKRFEFPLFQLRYLW